MKFPTNDKSSSRTATKTKVYRTSRSSIIQPSLLLLFVGLLDSRYCMNLQSYKSLFRFGGGSTTVLSFRFNPIISSSSIRSRSYSYHPSTTTSFIERSTNKYIPASTISSISLAPSTTTSTARKMSSTTTTTTTPVIRTALEESGVKGEFQRRDAAWRNWIRKGANEQFQPENGRYHLYVAYACPWAHRTLIVRALKGLQDVISVTVVHPTWQRTRPNDPNDTHTGWVFGTDATTDRPSLTNSEGNGGPFPTAFVNNTPDPFDPTNVRTIRDVYEKCKDTDGKYSVPILYDKKLQTIVSNESADIIRILNNEFNDFSTNPTLDLYPEKFRDAIDEVNAWVYPNINNGVYRCGFAKSQEAYDIAITELTDALDKVTSILQNQRYIAAGTDHITEADIRLFVTLLRFDEVYTVYFKTNTRFIWNNPTLLNYVREIYQLPGVASTVNMEQIKYHYFTSHPRLNYYSIVPRGNTNYVQLLEQPHNRDTIA